MVDQLKDLADSRLVVGCIYCGGPYETDDHVPSRVLLDQPYPENLPNVPACRRCNSGFSRDEEYLACLIEAVIAGSTDTAEIGRPRVAEILRRSPRLQSALESCKRNLADGHVYFEPDAQRVENIVLKLARGHVAFELSFACRQDPASSSYWILGEMSSDERDLFESAEFVDLIGEIGSRNVQRLRVVQLTLVSPRGEVTPHALIMNDWVDVQEGRYRYFTSDSGSGITVKMVIREYLACLVTWPAVAHVVS